MELRLELSYEEREILTAGLALYRRLHKTGWLNEEEYAALAYDEHIAEFADKSSIVSVDVLRKMKSLLHRILSSDWASLNVTLTPKEQVQFEAVFQAHKFVRRALRVLSPEPTEGRS